MIRINPTTATVWANTSSYSNLLNTLNSIPAKWYVTVSGTYGSNSIYQIGSSSGRYHIADTANNFIVNENVFYITGFTLNNGTRIVKSKLSNTSYQPSELTGTNGSTSNLITSLLKFVTGKATMAANSNTLTLSFSSHPIIIFIKVPYSNTLASVFTVFETGTKGTTGTTNIYAFFNEKTVRLELTETQSVARDVVYLALLV